MNRALLWTAAVILVAPLPLYGFPDGPLPRLTGGFGEDTCTRCHQSFALNAGRTLGGTFHIEGVPSRYEPGRTYALRVVIGQPGQQRWGFELSARTAGEGRQAGRLVPADELTQVKRAGGVQFIEHTEAGTRGGTPDGPVAFEFEWVAPEAAQGPVLFNAAGNAADGDNKTDGDYVYTAGAYSGSGEEPAAPLEASTAPADEPVSRRRAEDSRLSHLPTPRDLNRGNFEVLVQHRFEGSVTRTSALFGIDFGANINLGINYALTDRLSASISRARFFQNVALGAEYELMTRAESPWQMALVGGVQGQNNFHDHYSGYLQLPTHFDYKALRVVVVPTMVFNSRQDLLTEALRTRAVNPDDNHTFSLGLGVDLALNERFSISAEYVPRLAGFGGFGGERSTTAGGVKIRTWGHVFHLLFSNSLVMTPAEYAVNPERNQVMFGFNIYRRIGR